MADSGASTWGLTVRARLCNLPPLVTDGLRPAQIAAIRNLEKSLAEGRPRALIQMASGGGKTYTACNAVYRLIKHAGARRVLFLVDRSNLGRQTLKEFQQFRTPEEHRAFTELYNVQHMQSNKLDDVCKVSIATIQRLYAMLRGKELDPAQEEQSSFDASLLRTEPVPIEYNPAFRSRPSISSSLTSATARSTTSGARCSNTLMRSSSASPRRRRSRPWVLQSEPGHGVQPRAGRRGRVNVGLRSIASARDQ